MALRDPGLRESPAAAADMLHAPDEAALARYAAAFAGALHGDELVTLSGPLGAGKTSFVRAVLASLGHSGTVRSPTFTLVEPYEVARAHLQRILHLDLYRLENAGELELLGVREQFGETVMLIEWPEKGAGWLPVADVELDFDYAATGRTVRFRAATGAGAALAAALRALL
jgi:tRNA threonylcarbamoyladenosine biosynthesis protein TsaE